jgi:uncharacterized protein (DUF362 family)
VLIKTCVAIIRYEKPLESVRKVIELCSGLDHLPRFANVFIKPNIAFCTRSVQIPKWGVVTTFRVVDDMVGASALGHSGSPAAFCTALIEKEASKCRWQIKSSY